MEFLHDVKRSRVGFAQGWYRMAMRGLVRGVVVQLTKGVLQGSCLRIMNGYVVLNVQRI